MTHEKAENIFLFASNKNEKGALKKCLKKIDKNLEKNKEMIELPGYKKYTSDSFGKANENERKQMHIYIPQIKDE